MRPAGPALIHQNDIPVFLEALEQRPERAGHLRGALTGAAGEDKERVRLRIAAHGRKQHDPQVDTAPFGRGAILKYRQGATVCIGRALFGSTRP